MISRGLLIDFLLSLYCLMFYHRHVVSLFALRFASLVIPLWQSCMTIFIVPYFEVLRVEQRRDLLLSLLKKLSNEVIPKNNRFPRACTNIDKRGKLRRQANSILLVWLTPRFPKRRLCQGIDFANMRVHPCARARLN